MIFRSLISSLEVCINTWSSSPGDRKARSYEETSLGDADDMAKGSRPRRRAWSSADLRNSFRHFSARMEYGPNRNYPLSLATISSPGGSPRIVISSRSRETWLAQVAKFSDFSVRHASFEMTEKEFSDKPRVSVMVKPLLTDSDQRV